MQCVGLKGNIETTLFSLKYPLKLLGQLSYLSFLYVNIYWTGHAPKKLKDNVVEWLPGDIHIIPLQMLDPVTSHIVPYQGADVGATTDG